MTVYPPRNLPGSANEWGRAVEVREQALANNLRIFSQSSNNTFRAGSGQIAVSSGHIQELLNRRVDVGTLPEMTVSGTATAEPFPRTSQTFTFPAIPGVRSALLTFNASLSVTPLRGTPEVVFLRSGGVRLLRLVSGIHPAAAINPVESQGVGTVSGFCRIVSPNDQSLPVEVELVRGPDSTSSSITLFDIRLTLSRSGAL